MTEEKRAEFDASLVETEEQALFREVSPLLAMMGGIGGMEG